MSEKTKDELIIELAALIENKNEDNPRLNPLKKYHNALVIIEKAKKENILDINIDLFSLLSFDDKLEVMEIIAQKFSKEAEKIELKLEKEINDLKKQLGILT
jgi:hypothetical protein